MTSYKVARITDTTLDSLKLSNEREYFKSKLDLRVFKQLRKNCVPVI